MARCTVTFITDKAALSERVVFYPWPNQIISDTFIDNVPVVASVNGNTYSASLIQGAKYTVKSNRFWFSNPDFICPASSTASLEDLLENTRNG